LKTSAADAVFDLAEIVRESQRAPADLTDKPLARAFREQPALAAAWTDADKIRWGATTPMSTCLQLAQAIRRYSFNKY